MHKHSSKKYDFLKKMLAVCIVVLLVGSTAASAFVSEASENGQTMEVQEFGDGTEPELLNEEEAQGQTGNLTSAEEFTEQRDTEADNEDIEEVNEEIVSENSNHEEDFSSGEETDMETENDNQDDSDQEFNDQNDSDDFTDAESDAGFSVIQEELDSQMTALMTLDSVGEPEMQEMSKSLTDIYPQYADYNGEMEGVSVDKTWTGDAEYNRPESITLDLYLDDQVIDTLTLTAEDDWKGSFDNHYPAYKLDSNGTYALDENGERIPLNYQVKERDVTNYKAAYSQETYRTTVDSSSVHLFVPATELKAGEQYIVVSSNQPGQQKIYRAEAYQTDKMLSSQVTVSDKSIKLKLPIPKMGFAP